MYRKDLKCRCCESGENETQEHFTSCDFTKEMRKSLDLTQETDQLVLWRKLTRALQHVHNENNKNNEFNVDLETRDSAISPYQKGSEVPPVTCKETCQGNREGITVLQPAMLLWPIVPGTLVSVQ